LKKHLILPIAGDSSRYPSGKPKYALPHPKGYTMLTEAIRGINPSQFDSVLLIGRKTHEDKYGCITECAMEINKVYDTRVKFVVLPKQTGSQPETVCQGLQHIKIPVKDAILIKDSDGFFEYDAEVNWGQNHVAVADIHNMERINARNKSYVQIDENNTVGNIVEKQVISNLFCVGGYFFSRAKDFLDTYDKIKKTNSETMYVSHIIYQMLLDKNVFFVENTKNYLDWGTIEDWIEYKNSLSEKKSIVIDIDNTLSTTDQSIPYVDRMPKKEVIEKLREYQRKGYYIVIETGRQMKTYKKNIGLRNVETLPVLIEWLNKNRVPYDEIYIGKPWQGYDGFRVDDSTVRPDEFLLLSEDEIKKLVGI